MENLTSLIKRAQARNLDAFGRIVRRFQDMAVGYAYSILGDFHLAEDVAQEAFITAYRCLPKLRNPDTFPSWFRKIVLRHCNRLTRGERVETIPLEAAVEVPSTEKGPAETVLARELKDSVLAAIQALSENQQIVTTLFYINGYSQNEISDFLSVPVTTVKKRLQYSRKRLKEMMITMVQDTLHEKRPSRDEQFASTVQLFNAVEVGQLQKVKELLNNTPALVNVKNEGRQTPLHLAAYYGYKEIIQLLLANGAEVDPRDNDGRTPLHQMVPRCVRPDVAEVLLENGATINTTDNIGCIRLDFTSD